MLDIILHNNFFKLKKYALVLLLITLSAVTCLGQTNTTTWKGLNDDWSNSNNWTNGIPNGDLDVIIAKTNNDPEISKGDGKTEGLRGVITCKSLIIKDGATLYITNVNGVGLFIDPVNVLGDLTIESGGKLFLTSANLVVSGNWTNNGSYSEKVDKVSGSDIYPTVSFKGINTKYIGGSSTTQFSQISLQGTIILNRNVKVIPLRVGAYGLSVLAGSILDPQSFQFDITPKGGALDNPFIVEGGATLMVKNSKFTDNYSIQPSTVDPTSIVDYTALSGTQTVLNFTNGYGVLKISGGGVKELDTNTTVMSSNTNTKLLVEGGTLDLKTYTLNRTGVGSLVGGALSVSNGATLKIGSTNSMPSGYATITLEPSSTVDYYGSNQTVTSPSPSQSYGNLTLSGSGTKTLPATAMTIAGNFTNTGSATSTAAANLTVNGDVIINSSNATFNGGSATHTVAGNWTSSGTFTGNTSTVVMTGTDKSIASTGGTTVFNNLTISGTVTTASTFSVNGNLTVNSGRSLSASGGILTMSGADKTISNGGTATFAGLNITGTASTTSNLTINSSLAGTGKLTASGGTITFDGASATFGGGHDLFNVTINAGKALTLSSNAVLGVASTLATTGTISATASTPTTVNYNGSGAQTVAAVPYHHLTFSNSGTKSFPSGTTGIAGTFTVTGATANATSNSSTVDFNGNGAQTVAAINYHHLTLSNSGTKTLPLGAMTIAGNFTSMGSVSSTAAGNITVNGNVLISGSSTFNGGATALSHSIAGNATIDNGATFNGGSSTHTVAGDWTANGTFTPSSSKVVMSGNNKTISRSSAGSTEFNDLTLSGTGTSITAPLLTIRGDLIATGGLSQSAGGIITMLNSVSKSISGSNINFQSLIVDGAVTTVANFTVNGDLTIKGGKSFTATNGTVTMAGTGKSISNSNVATFFGLAITGTITTSSDFTVSSSLGGSGKLTATSGLITFNGTSNTFSGGHDLHDVTVGAGKTLMLSLNSNLGISGSLASLGTFDATTNVSTVNYNKSANQDILGTNYHHLIFSNSGTKKFASGITGIAGSFTVSGTATANATSNSTTVDYNGSVPQTVAAIPYHHLTLSNSNTKTLPATAMSIAGNFTSTGSATSTAAANLTVNGDVIIDANATFKGGSASHTVAGNWTSNGTFSGNTSTVTMSGSSKTISTTPGSTEFNNLTIAGTVTTSASFTVNGNLAVNSTKSLISNGGIITLAGTGKDIANTGVATFSGLAITGTATTTSNITINSSLGGTGKLTASNGTVTFNDASTFAGGHDLFNVTVASGKTLTLSSNSVLGVASVLSGTLNATSNVSTVNYNGSGAQSVLAIDYHNLSLSTGGTKTLAAGTTGIAGAFSVSGATANATANATTVNYNGSGAQSIEPINYHNLSLSTGGTKTFAAGTTGIAGNLTVTGATANATSNASTVDYNGSGTQTVGAIAYHHLNLSNAGTKTLPATAMSIAGNFTSTGSASSTAAANLTVGGNLLVSGTSTFDGGATALSHSIAGNATIDNGATFKGGSATHRVAGNWTANGTFEPNSSTVEMTGNNKTIARSSAGSTGFNNLTLSGTGTSITAPLVTIRGDLSATGGLSQSASGTITMTNSSSKSISGSNINFQSLVIDGTVTTNASFKANDNLTVNTGKSFTANNGTVTMAGAGKNIYNSGTATFSNLNIEGATSTSSNLTINSSLGGTSELTATAGTVTFGGTSTFGNTHKLFNVDVAGTSLAMLANSNMHVAGALTRTGAFNTTTNTPNTVTYNGTSAQSVLGTTYHNLVFSNAGTKTASSGITANGDVTINTGATFSGGSATHTVGGNWVANGNYTPGTSTVTLTGTGKNISSTTGSTGFNNLMIDGSITTGANLAVSGDLTVNTNKSFSSTAGTVTMTGTGKNITAPGSATFSGLAITGTTSTASDLTINSSLGGSGKLTATNGTVTFNDASTFSGGHDLFNATVASGKILALSPSSIMGVAGVLSLPGTLNATSSVSTVNYNGTAAQSIQPINYHNLSLSTGGTKTFAAGTTGIAGDLTVSGATADATTNLSTVNYNGSGDQVVGAIAYHHLTANKSSGTATYTSGANQSMGGDLTVAGSGKLALNLPKLSVAGSVSISGGTLETAGSSAIDLKGNWTRTGTFTPNTSTVTFSGEGAQAVAGTTFNHLSKVGTGTLTTTSNSTLNGDLNVQSGTLVLDGHTMNRSAAGGTLSLASGATLRVNNASTYPTNFTTSTLDPASAVVYSGGSAAMAAVTYGNLTVQDGSTRALAGNTRVASVMTVASGATVSDAAVSLTLDKDLINNGTISAASTDILFTGAAANLSGAGATTVKNLTVNAGSGVTVGKDITMYGNLVNNGTGFSAASNKIDLTGTNASSVSGSGPLSINQLRVSKTGAATAVTLNADIAGLQSVDVASGTLDAAARTLTKKAGGGTTLAVASASTMKVGGTNSLPDFDSYTLNPTSTVEYYGGAQAVRAVPYGNLSFKNTGTKQFAAGTTGIAGAFTVTGATADATTNTPTVNYNKAGAQSILPINYHNLQLSTSGTKTFAAGTTGIAGSLTRSVATLNATTNSSTIEYNGSNPQSVLSATYHNLVLSKSGTKTAAGAITINGDMTINPEATYDGSSAAHTVAGNWVSNGTFTPSSSTVTMTGTGKNISSTAGATEFNNLTINGTNVNVAVPALTVRGDLGGTGGYRQSAGGTLTMTNSASKNITGTNHSFQNLTINGIVTAADNLIVNENFTVNSGKSFAATAGTVTMAGTGKNITAPGSATFNSLAVTGTTSTPSNLTVKSSLGGTGKLTATGGTLTFDGASATFGGAHDLFNVDIPAGKALTLSSNSVLGVADVLSSPGTLDATSNVSTVNYNGASAQSVLPTNYHNLTLSNAGTKSFASGVTGIAGALNVTGAVADATTNLSTLNFNGGAGQVIPGLPYYGLRASGTGQKTLNANATIVDKLDMVSGTVNTGANKIVLGSAATITESPTSYVTGFVETQRPVTASVTQSFGGMGIELTSPSELGAVTVTRETGRAAGVTGNSVKRLFTFSNPGPNQKLNATLTYNYLPHELNGLDANQLALYRSLDGQGWEQHGNAMSSPSSNRVGVTGVSNLNQMALGSGASPLPVDLGYFKAEKLGRDAVLTWSTTNEEYNKGFVVEVSVDGETYRELGFVSQGTGTSRVAVLYTFTDREPNKEGVRYYRLKQLDFDGRISYYGPRALSFSKSTAIVASAYPNPFRDVINIAMPDAEGAIAKVSLSDTSGKVVLEQSLVVVNGDLAVDTLSGKIPAGMYLLTVKVENQLYRLKLMKK